MPVSSLTKGLPDLNEKQQHYLLQLARRSINSAWSTKSEILDEQHHDPVLLAHGACFVTLEQQQRLRGCIGTLTAHRPLIDDIWHNAQAAAFHDPRFAALTQREFADTEISLSILGTPQELVIADETDLLQQLLPSEHGVIIEHGHHRATFLPQVWTHFSDKNDFLIALRKKAGLTSQFTRDQRYSVYLCLYIGR